MKIKIGFFVPPVPSRSSRSRLRTH